jgi:hypothetical protein
VPNIVKWIIATTTSEMPSNSITSGGGGGGGAGQTQTQKVVASILAGNFSERFYEINYPNIWLRQRNQFKAMIERVRAEKGASLEWVKLQPPPDEGWGRVVKWLNHIIRRPENACKRQNVWICSKPNMGKTHFLANPLLKRLKIYMIQKDEVQNTPWEGVYDLAMCDEFIGQKTIEWMNEFMSDAQMQIRVPGGGFTVKDAWIPVLILSNLSIDEAYPKSPQAMVDALKERFWEINLTTRANPFGVPTNNNQRKMDKIFE